MFLDWTGALANPPVCSVVIVVLTPAIAGTDVEISIRAKGEMAAIVIILRLVVSEHHSLRGGIGHVRIGGGHLELRDGRAAINRLRDVRFAIGHPETPLLLEQFTGTVNEVGPCDGHRVGGIDRGTEGATRDTGNSRHRLARRQPHEQLWS